MTLNSLNNFFNKVINIDDLATLSFPYFEQRTKIFSCWFGILAFGNFVYNVVIIISVNLEAILYHHFEHTNL